MRGKVYKPFIPSKRQTPAMECAILSDEYYTAAVPVDHIDQAVFIYGDIIDTVAVLIQAACNRGKGRGARGGAYSKSRALSERIISPLSSTATSEMKPAS